MKRRAARKLFATSPHCGVQWRRAAVGPILPGAPCGRVARSALATRGWWMALLLFGTLAAPSSTTAQVAPTAQIVVITSPEGALVSVDGVELGRSPQVAAGLSPGGHLVVASSEDGRRVQQLVQVDAGRSVAVELALPALDGPPPQPTLDTAPARESTEIHETPDVEPVASPPALSETPAAVSAEDETLEPTVRSGVIRLTPSEWFASQQGIGIGAYVEYRGANILTDATHQAGSDAIVGRLEVLLARGFGLWLAFGSAGYTWTTTACGAGFGSVAYAVGCRQGSESTGYNVGGGLLFPIPDVRIGPLAFVPLISIGARSSGSILAAGGDVGLRLVLGVARGVAVAVAGSMSLEYLSISEASGLGLGGIVRAGLELRP